MATSLLALSLPAINSKHYLAGYYWDNDKSMVFFASTNGYGMIQPNSNDVDT
jgi:hypothetical protein